MAPTAEIRVVRQGPGRWAVMAGEDVMEVLPRSSVANAMAERLRRDAACQKRKCLCCKAPFLSWGPGNRLCDGCRKKDAFNGSV